MTAQYEIQFTDTSTRVSPLTVYDSLNAKRFDPFANSQPQNKKPRPTNCRASPFTRGSLLLTK